MKEPTNDREKALAILQLATGTAPVQLAAQFDGGAYSDVEIACLAHAYDQDKSFGFAHEVVNFSETRKVMEQIARDRMPPSPEDGDATVLDEQP